MTRKQQRRAEQQEPPPASRRTVRLTAAGVALGLLALYLATLCPTIHSGDAAELATAGSTWGIAHPPGYALYSLVANLWTRLLPLGEVAWRLNLLSALAGAGAALLLFFTLVRLGTGCVAAAFGALSLGLGASFWSQSLISEVYAFDLLLAAAAIHAAVRARALRSMGSAVLVMFCAGLWLCHRTVNLLYLPVLLVLAWPALRPRLGSLRGGALLAGALAAPLLALLYLPLASAADPLLDTGDPETWERFWSLVSARVYRQYLFSGDMVQNASVIFGGLPRELGAALLLAPLGLVVGWRRQRMVVLALTLAVGTNLLFCVSYGVPDVAVFVLPGILALAALAALALSHVARRLAALPAALLMLALVLPLGAVNLGRNNLRSQTLARDFARDALSMAGSKGLVLSHVDTVSFSLWYVQYVEQRRADLLVVSKGRAVDWHQRQAQRLRPDLAVPLYDGPGAISRWPAMLVARNAGRVPLYVTANLRGYFLPPDAARLAALVTEQPAGLMTRLVPRRQQPAVAVVVRQNEAFWRRAWDHALAAREQRLNDDMTSLLLHYASMRVLFARYCLQHGFATRAEQAARAVVQLDTEPLIAQVNLAYRRMGARYHMSSMPRIASQVAFLARALGKGRITGARARQQLQALLPSAPPAARAAPPSLPGPTPAGQPPEPPGVARLNLRGIELAKQGQLQAALPLFEQVLQKMPTHRGALFNRAKVLAMMGRRQPAIEAHQALLKLSPGSLPALVGLGDLLVASDPGAALKLYRKALDAPGPPAIKAEIKQRVEALQKRGIP